MIVVHDGDDDDDDNSNDGDDNEKSDNRDLRTYESGMRHPCDDSHAYQTTLTYIDIKLDYCLK